VGYRPDIVKAGGWVPDNYLAVWALFLDPRYEVMGAVDIIGFFRSSREILLVLAGAYRSSWGLERQPDIDATVLRASVASVPRAGEETVMAAGRRVRMIVAILCGWIRTTIVMVSVTLHRRMIVVMVLGVLVAMVLGVLVAVVLGVLVAMVFRMILGAHAQWHSGTQRERRDSENDRFPRLMTHGK
jgi:hypothetical protein